MRDIHDVYTREEFFSSTVIPISISEASKFIQRMTDEGARIERTEYPRDVYRFGMIEYSVSLRGNRCFLVLTGVLCLITELRKEEDRGEYELRGKRMLEIVLKMSCLIFNEAIFQSTSDAGNACEFPDWETEIELLEGLTRPMVSVHSFDLEEFGSNPVLYRSGDVDIYDDDVADLLTELEVSWSGGSTL